MNVPAAIAALCCTLLYATLHGSEAQLDWDAMTNQRSLQTGDVSFQGCRTPSTELSVLTSFLGNWAQLPTFAVFGSQKQLLPQSA
jgi:hypothetical protein